MALGNGQDWPPRRSGAGGEDPLADLRDLAERWRGQMPKWSVNPFLVLGILLILYLLAGIYIIAPDERGVVLRFGAAVRETGPGPHYHIPWPAERILKVKTTQIQKEEIGFRTVAPGPPAMFRSVKAESLMLTGDNNIVDLDFIVQYRVKDEPDGPRNYLFNVAAPQQAVRDAAEAAMRELIGASKINDALTEGKQRIQDEMRTLMQEILDRYLSGIRVVTVQLQDVGPPEPVSDAFKDVISAEQDKQRMTNEARGFANDIVPKARGQAAQILNEAQAYRETKVRDAEGIAQRFIAVYEEYAKAKAVTKERLYIETMEEVLARARKIILDEKTMERTVPYLPLEAVRKQPAAKAEGGP